MKGLARVGRRPLLSKSKKKCVRRQQGRSHPGRQKAAMVSYEPIVIAEVRTDAEDSPQAAVLQVL